MRLIFAYCLTLVFFLFVTVLIADEKYGEEHSVFPPIANETFRELFQQEKYVEAESIYLKTEKNPNPYWLALLKMKQGKKEEAINLLRKEISKNRTDDQKCDAIERATAIVADESPDDAISFLDTFSNYSEINNNMGFICFRARHLMTNGEFDKARTLVEKLLKQSSLVTGRDATNIENVLYSFISHQYAKGKTKDALAFFDVLNEKYPKIRLD
jgi:tetratricopeptide (TPR) repeat protein